MRGGRVWILVGAVALLAAGVLMRRGRPAPAPPSHPPSPAAPEVAAGSWRPYAEGDFQEKLAEVEGGRLRLRASTLGSSDTTVKVLGFRSAVPLRLDRETRILADVDWNRQSNGSYLTAGLVLSPDSADGNPLAAANWLKVEYVGVPPGKNGRLSVSVRTAGRDRHLFQEGWPTENREGRPLGIQKIELVLKAGGFELIENGRSLYSCTEPVLKFTSAHLCLQMTTHSNYPAREVRFDNVRWSE